MPTARREVLLVHEKGDTTSFPPIVFHHPHSDRRWTGAGATARPRPSSRRTRVSGMTSSSLLLWGTVTATSSAGARPRCSQGARPPCTLTTSSGAAPSKRTLDASETWTSSDITRVLLCLFRISCKILFLSPLDIVCLVTVNILHRVNLRVFRL